jgi:hypothetical protein
MTHPEQMPTAPPAFWALLARYRRNPSETREHLYDLDRDEMIALYISYMYLSENLFQSEHLDYLENNEGVQWDIASWVVTQGEDFYRDVYEHPEKTPAWDDISAPMLSGDLVEAFAERFNEVLDLVADPLMIEASKR